MAPLLSELNERSMLVVERSPSGSRYRLLETLRDFAAEQLDESREIAGCRPRHLAVYLARAEGVDEQRRRTGSDAGDATLVPDSDNYRAALSWSADHDPTATLRLAEALEPLWMIRSVAEGRAGCSSPWLGPPSRPLRGPAPSSSRRWWWPVASPGPTPAR